jgi:hypothetical protein
MTEIKSTLKLGVDFYFNEQKEMIFTESFLARRGYCCQSGCCHCPYGYNKKVNPDIPVEFQDPWSSESKENKEPEIYDGEIEEL